eukprot:gb/GECG01001926.1/.p1 GENE.gb/GECG01001926.1/~~gb/GECG01001926.1/.p1  ORF type:complete len:1641 (+),score=344.63 gb/GECG01001926.1/:1-4923(+)
MASTTAPARSYRVATTTTATGGSTASTSGSSSVNLEEAEEGYDNDGGMWKALESAKHTLQRNAHEYFTETQSLQREQMHVIKALIEHVLNLRNKLHRRQLHKIHNASMSQQQRGDGASQQIISDSDEDDGQGGAGALDVTTSHSAIEANESGMTTVSSDDKENSVQYHLSDLSNSELQNLVLIHSRDSHLFQRSYKETADLLQQTQNLLTKLEEDRYRLQEDAANHHDQRVALEIELNRLRELVHNDSSGSTQANEEDQAELLKKMNNLIEQRGVSQKFNLRSRLEHVMTQVADSKEEIDSIRSKHQSISSSATGFLSQMSTHLEERLDSLATSYTALKGERDGLRNENAELNSQLSTARKEVERLRQAIDSLETRDTSVNEELSKVGEERKDLQRRLNESNEYIDTLRASNEQLQQQIAESRYELNILQRSVRTKENSVQEANKRLANSKGYLQEFVNTLRSQLSDLKLSIPSSVDGVQRDSDRVAGYVHLLLSQYSSLQGGVESKKELLSNFQNMLDEERHNYQDQRQRAERLQQKNDELMRDYSSLEEQLNTERRQHELQQQKLEDKCERLTSEHKLIERQLQQERDDRESWYSSLNAREQWYENQLTTLRKEYETVQRAGEQKEMELSRLQRRLKEELKDKESAVDENRRLKDDLDRQEEQYGSREEQLRTQVERLHEELKRYDVSNRRNQQERNMWLQSRQNQLWEQLQMQREDFSVRESQLHDQVAELHKRCTEYEEEIEQWHSKVQEIEERRSQTVKQLQSAREKEKAFKEEYTRTKESNELLYNRLSEINQLTQSLKESKKEAETLGQALEEERRRSESLNSQLLELRESNNRLRNDSYSREQLEKELSESQMEWQKLSKELDQEKDHNKELKSQMQELRGSNERLQEELRSSQEELKNAYRDFRERERQSLNKYYQVRDEVSFLKKRKVELSNRLFSRASSLYQECNDVKRAFYEIQGEVESALHGLSTSMLDDAAGLVRNVQRAQKGQSSRMSARHPYETRTRELQQENDLLYQKLSKMKTRLQSEENEKNHYANELTTARGVLSSITNASHSTSHQDSLVTQLQGLVEEYNYCLQQLQNARDYSEGASSVSEEQVVREGGALAGVRDILRDFSDMDNPSSLNNDDMVSHLRELISRAWSNWSALRRQVDQMEGNLLQWKEKKRTTVKNRDNRIEQLTNQVRSQQRHIEDLRSTTQGAERKIDQMSSTIQNQKAVIGRLRSTVQNVNTENESLKMKLERVRSKPKPHTGVGVKKNVIRGLQHTLEIVRSMKKCVKSTGRSVSDNLISSQEFCYLAQSRLKAGVRSAFVSAGFDASKEPKHLQNHGADIYGMVGHPQTATATDSNVFLEMFKLLLHSRNGGDEVVTKRYLRRAVKYLLTQLREGVNANAYSDFARQLEALRSELSQQGTPATQQNVSRGYSKRSAGHHHPQPGIPSDVSGTEDSKEELQETYRFAKKLKAELSKNSDTSNEKKEFEKELDYAMERLGREYKSASRSVATRDPATEGTGAEADPARYAATTEGESIRIPIKVLARLSKRFSWRRDPSDGTGGSSGHGYESDDTNEYTEVYRTSASLPVPAADDTPRFFRYDLKAGRPLDQNDLASAATPATKVAHSVRHGRVHYSGSNPVAT